MKNEIVFYQADKFAQRIEVRIEDETVWLNRLQIADLFNRDVKTIGKHIANVLKEELKGVSVVAKFATTASDGKVYQVEYYNLDMIISIGYRVKSQRGIQFRIWANKILKDYLLKGYSLNKRINRLEDNFYALSEKVEEIDLHINSSLPAKQGVFFNGQIFDAYAFVSELIRTAQKSIILIDNYIDESVLMHFTKRKNGVSFTILCANLSKQLKLDLKKHNKQYSPVRIIKFQDAHDRFLILDEHTVYHFGASLKDLGRKWFAFSQLHISTITILDKLRAKGIIQ